MSGSALGTRKGTAKAHCPPAALTWQTNPQWPQALRGHASIKLSLQLARHFRSADFLRECLEYTTQYHLHK